MFLYKPNILSITNMTQKKRVLSTFRRYLKRKGFRNVKMALTENVGQGSSPDIKLQPDMSAESSGISYYYKYIETKEDSAELITEVKEFLKEKPDRSKRKLKLLVPIKQSDGVIQSLNAHQLENVGVIRVSPNQATA